jgi:Thioredoxin domain
VARKANDSVRIEILAREDCPNRNMALVVVERVVDETGIPADIEVVDVETDSDAEEYRVLGSPTVLVDGRDVDPDPTVWEYSADDRIYRSDRGPCGWPDPEWIRSALLRAVAQTTSNGSH